MAEKLTPQQAMAVENRGGKLLVSAAAGSGKTKVLVDRLMRYILDPNDPANIDEFLIITYTNAAAAELRGKIAAKLSEHIAAQPNNRHLHRQLQRLYLTKISTVHAFCADLLREYAYRIDVPADFRVADENECRELRDDTVAKLLERAYETAGENTDFCTFVDTQGLGRDDRLVPQIVLQVYDSARCHLDPQMWLRDCQAHTDVSGLTDAAQTLWGKYLVEDLFRYLDLKIQAFAKACDLAAREPDMAKPAALLQDTLLQLKKLRSCETWDEILAHKAIDYGRLVFSKKTMNAELAERIKAVRKSCKDGLEKKLLAFADPSWQVLADLEQTSGAVRSLCDLVRQFSRDYDRVKTSRRVLDFGDLEHKTLDLLLGKNRTAATQIAQEMGQRFREILVDEYQDSNAVQDAIFTALTEKRQNCFMVGDVKQSIYQFRLADPGIFLQKYHTFVPAEEAKMGEGRKIMLSSNFRSGGAVLAAANDVFRCCMSPQVGGLAYGDEEALHEGIPHEPLGESEIELNCLEVSQDTYLEEAAFTAQRISKLLDGTHMVRDKEGLRPIQPGDIVILLRSPGSVGVHYRQALESLGIRCSTGSGMNLLDTEEVGTLRSILQIISNPRQDIPLVAALASPVFGFTADQLAEIRGKNRKASFYEAMQTAHEPRTTAFLNMLDEMRRDSKMLNLAQLIAKIYERTHLDSIYGAMPGGALRSANLQTFYQLAVAFESRGRKDLAYFLEHLDAMEKAGLAVSAEERAADCVTLMSIHKSKGLEFPVVFLCGLSREFNRESLRAQVLCDKNLGLGLSAIDHRTRVRYPTVSKRAIMTHTLTESISEELRVLYVAMTRPKDRLIMLYSSKNLSADLRDIALRMDISAPELLTGQVVCPGEWILMAALQRTEAGQLHAYADARPDQTVSGEYPWQINTVFEVAESSCGQQHITEENAVPQETVRLLQKSLQFRYAHTAATLAPSKQTATQRKGRLKDQEAAENAQEPKDIRRSWRKPGFAGAESAGIAYGSAMHAVLQYIRYDACTDPSAVEVEIDRLLEQKLITSEYAGLVDCGKIAAFFATPLGKKLRNSQQVLREFKFSILDDGVHFDPDMTGEQVLLQGVVDCALIEDDGITVVDFKTDYVTEDTVNSRTSYYRAQVETYADALARIYELPVKAKYLYFFHMDCLVAV